MCAIDDIEQIIIDDDDNNKSCNEITSKSKRTVTEILVVNDVYTK